jgi:cell division protein FtsB
VARPPIAPPDQRHRTDARTGPPGAFILLALTLLIVAAIALGAARSYRDLSAARLRAAALERQITEADQRVEELVRRIERTRDDPVTWERLAREELGLVRPGDIVVMLPEAGEN